MAGGGETRSFVPKAPAYLLGEGASTGRTLPIAGQFISSRRLGRYSRSQPVRRKTGDRRRGFVHSLETIARVTHLDCEDLRGLFPEQIARGVDAIYTHVVCSTATLGVASVFA